MTDYSLVMSTYVPLLFPRPWRLRDWTHDNHVSPQVTYDTQYRLRHDLDRSCLYSWRPNYPNVCQIYITFSFTYLWRSLRPTCLNDALEYTTFHAHFPKLKALATFTYSTRPGPNKRPGYSVLNKNAKNADFRQKNMRPWVLYSEVQST